jgi:hypothetical protein
VLALDVVTADGVHRRVDADHDPDLFWALRGGGGSFGIVTALELQLFPITEVHAGVLFFPFDRAEEVLQAWREWLPTVPDTVTSVGRILKFPPLPELPAQLAGRCFAVVEVACQLDSKQADRLLAPLRGLGPELDTFRPTPMIELSQLHMDPPTPVPGAGDGMLLHRLDAELITSLVTVSEATGPALLSLELRQLGGAVRRGCPTGGAVSGFDADVALFAVGMTPTPEIAAAVHDAINAVRYRMVPWSTGRCYLNFAEKRTSGDVLFGAATHARLRQIKTKYDPTDIIRANQPVTPTGR